MTLASISANKLDYRKAFGYFQDLLHLIKNDIPMNKKTSLRHSARTYIWIGTLYYEKGDTELALENYSTALNIYSLNPVEGILEFADSIRQIGSMCHTLKAHKLALEFYDFAIRQYSDALQYLKQNLELLLSIFPECHHTVANYYPCMGQCLYQLNNLQESLTYFEKADQTDRKLSILPEENAYMSIDIQSVNMINENHENAIFSLLNLLEIQLNSQSPNPFILSNLCSQIDQRYIIVLSSIVFLKMKIVFSKRLELKIAAVIISTVLKFLPVNKRYLGELLYVRYQDSLRAAERHIW
ncbi:unnamed protein product [Didymodactylos carnosus]|uniref:Tetratricopeptide repeat protein n=1 Tax=Didymodactylos carnosus TaxID=1234261 RepID=A0A815PB85_9BILA|nr:unnamed protein product [Didymodactylos carnosus]CAF4321130.1 unnamed protein product [Didymodactylos carnosus]